VDAITEAYDGDVQMIDSSSIRVHQHAGCAKKSRIRRMGRSRGLINRQTAWANILPKRNRKNPICLSPHLYKARNLVESFFIKIKYFHRIATRHDKLAENYIAMVKLAPIRIWLRFYQSTA